MFLTKDEDKMERVQMVLGRTTAKFQARGYCGEHLASEAGIPQRNLEVLGSGGFAGHSARWSTPAAGGLLDREVSRLDSFQQVRAGDQPQDREGARVDDSAMVLIRADQLIE